MAGAARAKRARAAPLFVVEGEFVAMRCVSGLVLNIRNTICFIDIEHIFKPLKSYDEY